MRRIDCNSARSLFACRGLFAFPWRDTIKKCTKYYILIGKLQNMIY